MNRTSISYLNDGGEELGIHDIRGQEPGHDDGKKRRTSSTSGTATTHDAYDEWDEFIVGGAPDSDFSPPSPPQRPPGIRPPPTPPSTPLLLYLPGPRSTPSPTGPVGHMAPEAEDIVFFPTLRKWRINHLALQASGASPGPSPTARCPICRIRGLDIAELQPQAGSQGEESELELERTVVLFCGHMFGRECLTAWLKRNYGMGQEYVCPTCREDVCYASNGRAGGCGHHVSGVYVDRCGGILRVPATRDEGGRVPDRCDRCRASEWISSWAWMRGGGETVSDCSVGWGNRDVADGM